MKKEFLLLVAGLYMGVEATAQQKIQDGTIPGSALPNSNAIMELETNNKGLLMPRLALSATNNAAPLTAHTTGITVYNTATAGSGNTAVTPGFYINDGTQWIKLASASSVTDDQQLSLANNILSLEDGGSVSLAPYLDNTDNQQISLANNILTLTNGGSVNLTQFLDNTDNQQIQAFSLDGATNILTLTLEDGGTQTVNLSSLKTTLSNGTNTTVEANTLVGSNNTNYKVNVNNATATTTGAVKPGNGLSIDVATGTLSVNTSTTGIGKNFTSNDLMITNGDGATLTNVAANIKDGAVTTTKIANSPAPNQVLTSNGTNAPTWVLQSTLVPATTHTLTNPVNTITSVVNGVSVDAPAVNTVANSMSGSNLVTTVNGVNGTGLNLAPVITANQKTSSVVNGATTTVTSAPNAVDPNKTEYKVEVNTTAIQDAQLKTTLSNGTNTTVQANTPVGSNTTDYKVNVNSATATTTGAVKPGNGLSIDVATGTLSVNTSTTGIGKNFTSNDLTITNGDGATLTDVTANIKDGAVTPAKIANAGNNQVLTTNATGAPTWVPQSTLVPTTTHTLTNPVNTITSVVNGVSVDAPAVNTVANSMSGSNLITTVNGVNSTTPLNLTPVITANQKTSSVVDGITTTVTSAPNAVDPNKTEYKVEVNPAAIQNNQLKTTLSNGTNTTVASTTTGNTTDYKVSVSTATNAALGVVKQATTNPTVNIAADGTLSVNTTNTGIGKTLSADASIALNTAAAGSVAGAVLVPTLVQVANGGIANNHIQANAVRTNHIQDDAVTPAKLANAGNSQVLVTDAAGNPTWVNQSALPKNNIYTTDDALTANRTVDMNDKTLNFKTSGTTTRETKIDHTGSKSEISLTSATNSLRLIQNASSYGQVLATGPTTFGLTIGTGLGTPKPLLLQTNGTDRINISSTGKVGINSNASEIADINGTLRVRDLPANGAANAIYNGAETKATPFTATKTVVVDNNGVMGTVNTLPSQGNIYTTDGTLPAATNRVVNMDENSSLSFNSSTPGLGLTNFSYRYGARITNAATAGRSEINLSSNNAQVTLYQDEADKSQLVALGSSTGLIVGTNTATPLELLTTQQTRMLVKATGEVGVGTTSPTSTLHIGGSVAAPMRTTTASTTLTASDYTLLITGSGPVTITLPAASTCPGRMYRIVEYGSNDALNPTTNFTPAILSYDGFNTTSRTNMFQIYSDLNAGSASSNVRIKAAEIQSDGHDWYVVGN